MPVTKEDALHHLKFYDTRGFKLDVAKALQNGPHTVVMGNANTNYSEAKLEFYGACFEALGLKCKVMDFQATRDAGMPSSAPKDAVVFYNIRGLIMGFAVPQGTTVPAKTREVVTPKPTPKPVPIPDPEPAPEPAPEPETLDVDEDDVGGGVEQVDDTMTKRELLEFAEEHGVEVPPRCNKTSLIDIINEHLLKG